MREQLVRGISDEITKEMAKARLEIGEAMTAIKLVEERLQEIASRSTVVVLPETTPPVQEKKA